MTDNQRNVIPASNDNDEESENINQLAIVNRLIMSAAELSQRNQLAWRRSVWRKILSAVPIMKSLEAVANNRIVNNDLQWPAWLSA